MVKSQAPTTVGGLEIPPSDDTFNLRRTMPPEVTTLGVIGEAHFGETSYGAQNGGTVFTR